MVTIRKVALNVYFITLALMVSAHAGTITVYSGFDAGAGAGDPRPASDAAAAAFDAAAPSSIITFETAALGPFASLNAAPGVTVTGSDYGGSDQSIVNTSLCATALCGYNTTLGGSQWLQLYGGSGTFTFALPQNAFGFYISGLQVSGETISFVDGDGAQVVNIPNGDYNNGGIAFVGFTDTSAFSSATINVLNDIVGVDDVRYMAAVPEPATVGLLGAALVGLGLLRRRRA